MPRIGKVWKCVVQGDVALRLRLRTGILPMIIPPWSSRVRLEHRDRDLFGKDSVDVSFKNIGFLFEVESTEFISEEQVREKVMDMLRKKVLSSFADPESYHVLKYNVRLENLQMEPVE